MSEEQTNFKVTDRRLFNADGSPREVPIEEKSDQAPVILDQTGSAARTAEAEGQKDRQRPSVRSTQQDDDESSIPADADDPSSFINFIMSVASNAASSLGMMEHPVTNKREVDLELGKHWIDVLGMLQRKTQGNLSAQERKILEGLLADLRMQYVSLVNSPQSKASAYTGSDITGGR